MSRHEPVSRDGRMVGHRDGSALALTAMALAVCAVALVAVVDVAAYLVAATRAQAAADAAALAAVARSDPRGGTPGHPAAAAARAAVAGGGSLVSCTCPPRARQVAVVVRVPVRAVAVTRVAARAVEARASARLIRPPPAAPP